MPGGPPPSKSGIILVQTLIACLLVTLPRPAPTQPAGTSEPWLMGDEELQAEGWEFGDMGRHSGSIWGGILASTVGTVVHGVGHLYAGDTRTGTALLISEGVSLGLVGGGLLTQALTDSDGGMSAVYRPLTMLGAGLFITSWLLDVIGTFKGTSRAIPTRADSLNRLGLAVGYTHLVEQGFPLSSALLFDVEFDLGWLFFVPRGGVGIDNDYLSLGAATGLRFGFGRRPYSFIDLQLEGDEVIFNEFGYAYESLVISVGLSLNLGDIFAHLDGIVYQNRLGFGTQLFRFAFDSSSPLNADNTVGLLVVQSNLNARLTEHLLLDTGYVQRPDTLVGNLSRSLGAFFATLSYELPARFELFVDGRIGKGVQIFSGAAYYLNR